MSLYTEYDIVYLKREIRAYSLQIDPDFWKVPNTELARICNGIGPENMSEILRKILTTIYHRYQAAGVAHDYDYEKKKISKTEADTRFYNNMLRIWEQFYGWRRFLPSGLKERFLIRSAYLAVKNFGDSAWEPEK